MKKLIAVLALAIFLITFFTSPVLAVENKTTCIVYFTGIGCPHCTKADPFVLEQLPEKYPNLVIIEYEIYQQGENAPFLYDYNNLYNSGLGIPLVIFDKESHIIGDNPILKNTEMLLEKREGNPCPLINGDSISFEKLDLSSLPGKPKIWTKDSIGVWVEQFQKPKNLKEDNKNCLTFSKIFSLALVDAVNPCALAVLTLMLIAILTYNPKKRQNILLAGLAFTASVFIMYLFYGLIIIRFFQLIQALTSIKLWLYKILGVLAVGLGILNIKDFVKYKPGGLGTEMPMALRPKLKKIISGITNPIGAFGVGAFVTLFLLPCTVGPYIICGGILSTLSLLKTIPWLFLYNLIFIFPMLLITLVCYIGFTTVENVSGWKDKNIRYLHLVAGVIILSLGIAMVLGLV